jgi:hypothetical protein
MKLHDLKPLSVFKLFSDEECDAIISSLDESEIKYHNFIDLHKLKVDAFRINETEFNPEIRELIYKKVKWLSRYDLEQCFILKYSQDTLPSMQGHYDICKDTLVINLNNDFEGGETHFPLKGYYHKPQEYGRGDALYFKGDTLFSYHQALPVTKGVKYSLNIKFNKKRPLRWYFWALFKFYIPHLIFMVLIPRLR